MFSDKVVSAKKTSTEESPFKSLRFLGTKLIIKLD